jgi:hypothetical protein
MIIITHIDEVHYIAKSYPHRARHHICHYVCAMTSYSHDASTQKLAVLIQEY